MKYQEVKDLASLNAACKDVSSRADAKGREVLQRWEEAKEAYSPASVIASGIRSISSSIPFDKIVLWGIRAFRAFLR